MQYIARTSIQVIILNQTDVIYVEHIPCRHSDTKGHFVLLFSMPSMAKNS